MNLTKILTTVTVLLAIGIAAMAMSNTVSAQSAPAASGVAIGATAPGFELTDTDGNTHSLESYIADGKTVILEWFNPDCPYVMKYHAGATGNDSMRDAYTFAAEHDMVWLAVNSNRPGSQGDGLERNQLARTEYAIDYPVLLDPTGVVGTAYGAKNTPQIYIISAEQVVEYNGGADDTVLNSDTPGVNYVIGALTQLMAGEEINPSMTPHPGCSVKYPK